MGNGASACYAPQLLKSPHTAFKYVEDLCRSGHFHETGNAKDYETAIASAIRACHMDVLEVLLISGNVRELEVPPIVTAVHAGQLDVLELLVSAGFDVAQTHDPQCLTALHVAAKCRNENAAACGAYLALRGKERLGRFRTIEGHTAFHTAVKKGNAMFLRYVLPCYSDQQVADLLSLPDREGKKARQLAVALGNAEVLQVLDDHSSGLRGNQHSSLSLQLPQKRKPVDEARMMAVWETFFENAMKMMIGREVEEERAHAANAPRGKRQAASYGREYDLDLLENLDEEDQWAWSASSSGAKALVKDTPAMRRQAAAEQAAAAEAAVSFWFDHVMMHQSKVGSDLYWFVRKSDTEATVWLEEHIYNSYHLHGQLTVQPTPTKELIEARLPRLVLDSLRLGWVTYYDSLSNRCLWLNIHTWRCENTLPLGGDPMLGIAGLWDALQQEDVEEVVADTAVQDSWVLVVVEPKEDPFAPSLRGRGGAQAKGIDGSDQVFEWDAWDEAVAEVGGVEADDVPYYYNRITGSTSLTSPPNYDEINERRGGWQLVCSEASQWAYYWYHRASGESVWVEV